MKTILEIAKKCGANNIEQYNEYWLEKGSIVFDNEAQLTATIDLWNRQNSEPVGQAMESLDKEYTIATFNSDLVPLGTNLFTAPPQPQTVREALEMAAQVCAELGEKHHTLAKDNQNHMYISGGCDACDYAICDLIDQPQPPAKG